MNAKAVIDETRGVKVSALFGIFRYCPPLTADTNKQRSHARNLLNRPKTLISCVCYTRPEQRNMIARYLTEMRQFL